MAEVGGAFETKKREANMKSVSVEWKKRAGWGRSWSDEPCGRGDSPFQPPREAAGHKLLSHRPKMQINLKFDIFTFNKRRLPNYSANGEKCEEPLKIKTFGHD